MQKLAGLTEIKVNKPSANIKLKQIIQKDYPDLIADGEVETGTEEWIDLLFDSLKSTNTIFEKAFENENPYKIFINDDYEEYYNDIENIINDSDFSVTDLTSLIREMDYSDLIDAVAESMGGDPTDEYDMEEAKTALLHYGVNKLHNYSYVTNLEQALEELGIEII
jgi:hypothetical protein